MGKSDARKALAESRKRVAKLRAALEREIEVHKYYEKVKGVVDHTECSFCVRVNSAILEDGV